MATSAESGAVNSEKLLEHLARVEGIAEEILADKQKLVDLDRVYNQTRQAIRILKEEKNNKQWLCLQKTFIKMEKKSVSTLLHKELEKTVEESEKTRNELNPKINHLRYLENKEAVKGLDLKPLSKDEITAVTGV